MTTAHDEQSDERLATHAKLDNDNDGCRVATQEDTDAGAAQLNGAPAKKHIPVVVVAAAALITGPDNDKRVLLAQRESPPGTCVTLD
jgi:hypothetical protein